jgi:hypothetical protein
MIVIHGESAVEKNCRDICAEEIERCGGKAN